MSEEIIGYRVISHPTHGNLTKGFQHGMVNTAKALMGGSGQETQRELRIQRGEKYDTIDILITDGKLSQAEILANQQRVAGGHVTVTLEPLYKQEEIEEILPETNILETEVNNYLRKQFDFLRKADDPLKRVELLHGKWHKQNEEIVRYKAKLKQLVEFETDYIGLQGDLRFARDLNLHNSRLKREAQRDRNLYKGQVETLTGERVKQEGRIIALTEDQERTRGIIETLTQERDELEGRVTFLTEDNETLKEDNESLQGLYSQTQEKLANPNGELALYQRFAISIRNAEDFTIIDLAINNLDLQPVYTALATNQPVPNMQVPYYIDEQDERLDIIVPLTPEDEHANVMQPLFKAHIARSIKFLGTPFEVDTSTPFYTVHVWTKGMDVNTITGNLERTAESLPFQVRLVQD